MYNKKKLLIVSHVLNRSGAPTSLLRIVEKLSNEYDIIVLALTGGELENEYKKYSKLVYIPKITKNTIINKFFKFIDISKFIIKENPNLVLINTSVNNMTLVISWLLRKKTIVYIRESENMLKFHYKKYLLKLTNHIIAVSNETKKWICKYVDETKISVIYNGIDFNNEIKLPKVLVKETSSYTISIIGYMCPRKGSDFFLELILRLSKKKDNINFKIVGDFESILEKEIFIKTLKKHNLDKKILITGIVENVYEHINDSDIVVMMSREEALPRSVMEAAFMKKTVVAFDTAGTKEMLPNQEFIVPQFDIELFINKILNIINNNRFNQIGLNNYEYIKENFNLQKQIIKLKKTIEQYEE